MGKGAEECRTETERRQHAQEEDDVSRRSKKNCRSPTSEMGEGEGCPEEVCVRDQPPTLRCGNWRLTPDRLLQDIIKVALGRVAASLLGTERRPLLHLPQGREQHHQHSI